MPRIRLQDAFRSGPVSKLLRIGPPRMNKVTQLLFDWSSGDEAALDKLIPLIEQELQKLTQQALKNNTGATLQGAAIIDQAYQKLIDEDIPDWKSKPHFFCIAAPLMRQIMVNYVRLTVGTRLRVNEHTGDKSLASTEDANALLAFDQALRKLATFDERKCRIIEMRSFGGMNVEETARVLGVLESTVVRDLRLARAWLKRELETAKGGMKDEG